VLALVSDPIPNIRFNVAKSLEVLSTTLGASKEGKDLAHARILPAVQALKNDSDADVRYFASKAFEKTVSLQAAGE
jgi:serine/threonine-protein phosphatase 2A regulatory subunit A